MSSVLQAGTTVSHYRIVSRLGAGGMGEVYKAQDTSLDRTIALKILPPELVRNQDRVRRFVQEAKAASGLSHPHIVTIHEIGEIPLDEQGDGGSGLHFIAMEFVNGSTLRIKIHDQNTSLKDLLEYLSQAADALAKAHTAGIIHRDLKPDNIMVTQDGYAKVLDFGLAKLTERASPGASGVATAVREQTREGVVVGTVGYMSPEQVKGQPLDHRADIFSFGCVLYEAAARKKPFDADSDIDVMHKIVHDDPPPVSEVNPAVPAELRRMIRRCLAKDPDRRYQSMKDLSIELRDLAQEFETLTPSGSIISSPGIAPKPRWRLAWAGVALAVAVLAAIVLMRRPATLTNQAPPGIQASFAQLTDAEGVETSPRFSPDGSYIVYVKGEGPNRDIYLQRIGGRKPINLTDSPQADFQPAISPDGQLIAFRSARQGGGIFVMGATGESVRRLADFGFAPAWSPDGKELVVATEGGEAPGARFGVSELWKMQYPSGQRTLLFKGDAVQPAWSPHGHRIAYWAIPEGGSQRDIWTIPPGGGEPVAVTNDPALDWNPVWSPDGKYLYFSSDRGGSMNLWRVAIDEQTGVTLGEPQAITTPARWAGHIDISPDGRKLVFAALDPRNRILKIAFDPSAEKVNGEPQPVSVGGLRHAIASISPDGRWLTFHSVGGQEDICLARADGGEVRKLTDDPPRDRGPRWSPDGKQIVFYSDRTGRYELWTVNPENGELRQLTATTGPSVWSPIWSPDGTKLAGSNEFGSFIVDLSRGLPARSLTPLPPLSGEEMFLAHDWSPDGKWLVGNAARKGEGPTVPGTLLPLVVYSFEIGTYERLAETGGRAIWLPDNRRILFQRQGQFHVIDRVSRKVRQVSSFAKPLQGGFADVTPDARSLYTLEPANEGDIWMVSLK